MKVILIAIALLVAVNANAQTVTNPTTLEFTPSADHDVVASSGLTLVDGYTYNAVGMNGSGAIAVTIGIGKPTPVGGLITVPLPGLALMTVNVSYTATVTAFGLGGSGVSAPSNPFVVAGLTAPAAPSNVRVR